MNNKIFGDIYYIAKEIGRIEECYTNEYGRQDVIGDVLANILKIAEANNFEFEYVPSEWVYYDDEEEISVEDFYDAYITEYNYEIGDRITTALADKLIDFLRKEDKKMFDIDRYTKLVVLGSQGKDYPTKEDFYDLAETDEDFGTNIVPDIDIAALDDIECIKEYNECIARAVNEYNDMRTKFLTGE